MMIGRNLVAMSAALLLAGCPGPQKPAGQEDMTGGGTGDMRTGDGSGGGDDGGGGTTFSGTSIGVNITQSGDEQTPDDFSELPVAGLVPNSAASYPAAGKDDGTFTIPGLPAGAAWIRQGTDRFIYTTARTIDLNHYHLGRPDRVMAEAETPVSLSMSGLSAWAALDDVQLTIGNLGFLDAPLQYAADLPPIGATTVMDAQFDWRDLVFPWVVDPNRGDQAIFSQLSTTVAAGMPYLSLSRSASVPTLAVRDGVTATMTVAMTTTAPQQSLTVNWRRSRFEALRTAVHPSAQSFSQDASVSANPGGAMRADFAEMPDLLRLQPDLADTDLALGALSYRNPFPTGWTVYGRFSQSYRVAYTVPGAPRAGTLVGMISVADTAERLGAAAIEPVVSPVTNITVNGMAALSNLNGVGATPTVRWDAPAVGNANGFIVTLYRLEPVEGQQFPRSTRVATFYTAQSAMPVPAGLMATGKLYCFLIRAVSQPGVDISKTPYLVPVQRSYADALTALIAP